MVNVLTEIIIEAPAEIVSEYAANPDNASDWCVKIKSVEWKTPKPMQVGSQVAFKAQFLGLQLEYTYKFIEYVPGQKLVMRTVEGPFPMETTYTFETVKNGKTRMTLRNAGQPSGFSKPFAPIISIMMKKANKKDLKLLKQILEKCT